jgi:hypothetical protein
MAWTQWYRPQQVAVLTQNEIDYTDGDSVLDRPSKLISVAPLYGVGTSAAESAVNVYGGNSLQFSGFGITESGTVLGIEVETHVLRLNRICDSVVQLYFNGLLGKNLASDSYDSVQRYGAANNTWGISGAVPYTESGFGVVLDLAPHPRYPSSTRPVIRSVQMRLYLS